jgi:hypothetical protein
MYIVFRLTNGGYIETRYEADQGLCNYGVASSSYRGGVLPGASTIACDHPGISAGTGLAPSASWIKPPLPSSFMGTWSSGSSAFSMLSFCRLESSLPLLCSCCRGRRQRRKYIAAAARATIAMTPTAMPASAPALSLPEPLSIDGEFAVPGTVPLMAVPGAVPLLISKMFDFVTLKRVCPSAISRFGISKTTYALRKKGIPNIDRF